MPTTQDGKKTGSAARAEAAEDTKFTSNDSFENPALKELANTATVRDGFGIERIVMPATPDFTPAATEATDEQKANMAKFQGKLDEAAGQRASLLSGGSKDAEEGAKNATKASDVGSEDRLPNTPGDAGSQSAAPEQKDGEKAGANVTQVSHTGGKAAQTEKGK